LILSSLGGENCSMEQITGSFKLVYRGIDGYDLLFSRIDGFGGSEERGGDARGGD